MYVAKLQFLTDIEANKKNSNRNILHEGKFMQASQGYTGIPFLNWYIVYYLGRGRIRLWELV